VAISRVCTMKGCENDDDEEDDDDDDDDEEEEEGEEEEEVAGVVGLEVEGGAGEK